MINSRSPLPGRLHVLTDFHFQQQLGADQLAAQAIAGGADTIQFRQKRGPVRHKLIEAQRVAQVCRDKGVTCIVDDHIDICLAVGGQGVHLGQEDFPVDLARRILGDEYLIGATATSVAQAREAWNKGADYVGFGPVFPSRSKDNIASVKGPEILATVCAAVPIPVIAIAGITIERIETVMRAGAFGVAVLRAVSGSLDPSAATAALKNELNRWIPVSSAAAS